MSGIYLHIPFCKKACHYCNFHFSTSLQQLEPMVNAICKEAVLRKGYLNDEIATIYFGGGTPSLLGAQNIEEILATLRRLFVVAPDAEITLEANPDDISAEALTAWKSAGINRLSIGIQSFFEKDLRWMNRAHNAELAMQSIRLAREHGFSNITIDLIYGTPGLTDEAWKYNVDTALSLNIPHLSCYALTVEPKTALAAMIEKQKADNVNTDTQARQFSLLTEWLADAGFEHYEISNFAKPGFRSRHNSSYWQGNTYLGLGPSAHSFDGSSRQWNIANNALYLQSLETGQLPFEKETLTATQQLNEYIMTALRTIEGISLENISAKWGVVQQADILVSAKKHIEAGHLLLDGPVLRLTAKGKFFADGIASDLFEV